MSVDSVKIFEQTRNFKIAIALFMVAFFFMYGYVLTTEYDPIVIGFFSVSFVPGVFFGGLAGISHKWIVTSDAIISEHFFKKREILFKDIKRIDVKQNGRIHLLYVTTAQSEIRFYGGATQKQLDEMASYILEKIRVNNPEQSKLVNLLS